MGKAAILCSLVLGAALGFLFGRIRPLQAPQVPEVTAPDSAASASLQTIQAQLAELQRSFAALQLGTASRQTADGAGLSLGELQRAQVELRALVEGLANGASAAAASPALDNFAAQGFGSRPALESALAASIAQVRQAGDEEHQNRERSANEALTAQHGLWTLAQLLRRYGRPDVLEDHGNALALRYDLPREPGRDSEWIRFFVKEGVVYRADLNFSW